MGPYLLFGRPFPPSPYMSGGVKDLGLGCCVCDACGEAEVRC